VRFHSQLDEALEPLESDDVFMSEVDIPDLISRELKDLSDDQLRKVALGVTMEPFQDDHREALRFLADIMSGGLQGKPYEEMSRDELINEIVITLSEYLPDEIIGMVREFAKE